MPIALPSLRSVLLTNAVTSGGMGLICLVAAAPVADLLGFAWPWLLATIGFGLVLFGLGVGLLARQHPIVAKGAKVVIALDIAWVVGSALLLILAPASFGWLGKWLVALCALVVAEFALLQFVGLRREQASRLSGKAAAAAA